MKKRPLCTVLLSPPFPLFVSPSFLLLYIIFMSWYIWRHIQRGAQTTHLYCCCSCCMLPVLLLLLLFNSVTTLQTSAHAVQRGGETERIWIQLFSETRLDTHTERERERKGLSLMLFACFFFFFVFFLLFYLYTTKSRKFLSFHFSGVLLLLEFKALRTTNRISSNFGKDGENMLTKQGKEIFVLTFIRKVA